MSGPKSSTVTYQPTAAEVRAARRAQLLALAARSAEFAERRARLAVEWRGRAPVGARGFASLQDPAVAVVGADADPGPALDAGTAALRRAECALAALVTQCVQEEVRIIARRGATDGELAAAGRSARTARVSTRRRAAPSEGDEEPVPGAAEPVDRLPAEDVRAARIADILGRASVPLDGAAVARCTRQVLGATDEIAFQSALAQARRLVEEAETAAAKRARARAEAEGLLESLVGLTGVDVDRCRSDLSGAAEGRSPLPAGAESDVDRVRRAAVNARLIEVLFDAGCQTAPGPDADVLVGYIGQPGGGATKVRLDGEGLLVTPVSVQALDAPAARRLDEENCALFGRIQAGAAAIGVRLDPVVRRAVGETPVRVESLPFGAGMAAPAAVTGRRRPAPSTETQRRNA